MESLVEMSCYTWVTYTWVTNDMCYTYMRHELYESRTIYESMVGSCYTWSTNYMSHEQYARYLYESRTMRVTNHMREHGRDWVMLQMSHELYESRVVCALHLSHELYETRAVWESMVEIGSCYMLAMGVSCRTLEYVTSLIGMRRVLCVGAQPWGCTAHVTGDGERDTVSGGDEGPS